MIEVTNCEVCGGNDLLGALDLGSHPMCDDLVSLSDTRMPKTYPIKIVFCPTCKTAHQRFQIPKQTLFPITYHYRARNTADVLNGMRQLVERCEKYLGQLKGKTALDIGCNDGSLLSIFAEYGVKTLGIEPTDAAIDAQAVGHEVYQKFLTPQLAKVITESHDRPDIITFTNVFAHIEDLHSVLAAIRTLMGPRTLLVIENHYLGAVLARYQFDTFYHEHPRTYSLTSFQHIAEALGSSIVAAEFPERYGGNMRVMMQREPSDVGSIPDFAYQLSSESDFGERLIDMGRRIPLWRQAKRDEIEMAVRRYGRLPGKAFPGRAAILITLLGLDENLVSAIYEKPGSMKIGRYVPGTRIPILSDEDFASRSSKDAPLINFAWHVSAEIHSYMRKRGYEGEILEIFSAEDFDRLSLPDIDESGT